MAKRPTAQRAPKGLATRGYEFGDLCLSTDECDVHLGMMYSPSQRDALYSLHCECDYDGGRQSPEHVLTVLTAALELARKSPGLQFKWR